MKLKTNYLLLEKVNVEIENKNEIMKKENEKLKK
jgi:hypothetical protein